MEKGILKRSFLSLKQAQGALENTPGFTVAYKHYILFIGFPNNSENDCGVLDTQKGTVKMTTTGLQLQRSEPYSLSYWKDNMLVLYRHIVERTATSGAGLFGGVTIQKLHEIYVLHVLEDPYPPGISFKVVRVYSSKMSDAQCPDGLQPIQVYKDHAYVLVGEKKNAMEVWKYDLHQHAWNMCKVTGEVPEARQSPCSVLFRNKIYLIGGVIIRGQGLFSKEETANDLFVLDLETMKWERIRETDFLPTIYLSSMQAETIGQNIYISSRSLTEFFIYNPDSNTLQKSEEISPKEGFTVKSFDNETTLLRFAGLFGGKFSLEYQTFNLEDEKTEKIEAKGSIKTFSSPLSHMEFIWKEKSFADVTFIVQGEEILAHRVILLKSRYFQNMFQSGMIEANSDKINVPDISSTNFKAILEYIYCDKVTLTEELALDLIILADMYFLTKLKADCEDYLSTHLKIKNLLNIVKAAETADSEKLNERVVSFLIANIDKVKQEIDIHVIPPELFIKAISNLKQDKK